MWKYLKSLYSEIYISNICVRRLEKKWQRYTTTQRLEEYPVRKLITMYFAMNNVLDA